MKVDSELANVSPRPYRARTIAFTGVPGFRCAPPWDIFDPSLQDGKPDTGIGAH